MSAQPHIIDFSRQIKVMANGQNGPATSDSRNATSGTVVPPDGIRLPATPGSIKKINQQTGMDQSGLLQLRLTRRMIRIQTSGVLERPEAWSRPLVALLFVGHLLLHQSEDVLFCP